MLHNRLRAASGNLGDGIPTNGLVAWYTMDNVSGSTLVDEQGSFDGTISGASQASGYIGQGLSFDGVNDNVNSMGNPITSGSFAISFWVKGTAADRRIVDLGRGTGGPGTVAGVHTKLFLSDYFVVDDGAGGSIVMSSGDPEGAPPNNGAGSFTHVIAMFDDNTKTASYYTDGVLWRSVTNGSLGSVTYTHQAVLGANANGLSTQFLNGTLDQVRIYSRTLNADEIESLFNEV